MMMKKAFVVWVEFPLWCAAALLKFWVCWFSFSFSFLSNKTQPSHMRTSCMCFGKGGLINYPNNRFLKVLTLPHGTVLISWHTKLNDQKMTKIPFQCSIVNRFYKKCPLCNTTFISGLNDNLPVTNRSWSNYFVDIPLNLNNSCAE